MTDSKHQQRDQEEIVQPTDDGAAPLSQQEADEQEAQDPVTARNGDPAAMSEHERNLRQAEQYGA